MDFGLSIGGKSVPVATRVDGESKWPTVRAANIFRVTYVKHSLDLQLPLPPVV